MIIAAWALGTGSCWIRDFSEEKVTKLLSIPAIRNVVALLSLGHPSEKTATQEKEAHRRNSKQVS